MKKNTHLLGGVFFALLFDTIFLKFNFQNVSFLSIINGCLYYLFALIGAILPDIDKAKTYISNKVSFFSWIIRILFKHRTFTHSILFVVFLAIFFSNFHLNLYISLGVLIGVISHIFLDMLNPVGVQLFYPMRGNIMIMKITTGSFIEQIIEYCLVILIVITAANYFIN